MHVVSAMGVTKQDIGHCVSSCDHDIFPAQARVGVRWVAGSRDHSQLFIFFEDKRVFSHEGFEHTRNCRRTPRVMYGYGAKTDHSSTLSLDQEAATAICFQCGLSDAMPPFILTCQTGSPAMIAG
mmetsp:Transcript_27843/g.50756  ORF Transcript_27843/g.50756 Transcript_27843/m.50756 type:complete len:125 (-) Transcript_27843:1021-1395(-)